MKLESPATDRQEALQTIQTVRANLWRAPIDRLHDKLDRLEIDEHPDLVRSVSRLQVVLANGPLLESVLGHPEFDADFFAVYQKLLAGAPTETGVLRERAIASFASRKLRRRGLKTISLIEQAAPALAELEQEWLATLKRQRAKLIPRRDPGKLKRSQPKKIGWKWWEVVVCAVLLGFALLRILKDIFE